MEAGGKDCEEETLQTAFKKLRVDAESLPGAVSASEAMTPRGTQRSCLDSNGAKPKLVCSKDNWHGCTRKTSRGASRTQRRRRSKSPILQAPKFTYCSTTASSALSPPSGCLKHQRLAPPEPAEPCPVVDGKTLSSVPHKELSSSGAQSHISTLVFGSSATYDTQLGVVVPAQSLKEIPAAVKTTTGDVQPRDESSPEKSACDGAEGRISPLRAEASDFRALSELNSSSTTQGPQVPCSCAESSDSTKGEEEINQTTLQCRCQSNQKSWHDVELYSFTGLRNVISECERATLSQEDAPRTVGTNTNAAPAALASPASPPSLSSGSPRSCSEQARAYVDDITIEDLSGYMEYYLYIPKKMSHMAEMMYT